MEPSVGFPLSPVGMVIVTIVQSTLAHLGMTSKSAKGKKVKKKSCLATRHGGTLGERRYSSYSFLISALDGGEWSASRPGRALPPGKEPPVPIG
jgi:hypothetical protein